MVDDEVLGMMLRNSLIKKQENKKEKKRCCLWSIFLNKQV